jgi:bifunctional non-homologous end joining protein LigD
MSWPYESYRHYLAGKGIASGRKKLRSIKIMRPSQAKTPPKQGYLAERKFDGSRVLAYMDKHDQVFVNRRGVDKTGQYPEFDGLKERLNFKSSVILDGEVVSLKGAKDSFKDLASREHLENREIIMKKAKEDPLTYMAFDVLEVDGKCVRDLPLIERKKILDKVIPDDLKQIKEIKTTENVQKFTKEMKNIGAEGVIFKKEDSKYHGHQGKDWLKLKFQNENDVAILGYTAGEGKRKGKFGSLVTGIKSKEGYKYTGNVGTGFDESKLTDVSKRLKSIETSKRPNVSDHFPEKNIRWVQPRMVARIKYVKQGSKGRYREPVFVSLRSDLSPSQTHA